MKNIHGNTSSLTRRLVGAAAALALLAGCAPGGAPAGASLALRTKAAPASTASQVYNLLYTLKTNSMAAAARGALPEERVSASCEAFLYDLNQISPGLEFRLEIDPFVDELFLVDGGQAGGCYGCKTNMIYLVNGGRLMTDANSQGVAWVLPIGPNGEKAVFILSSVAPQRTTIVLLDDPFHGRLLYDSFATPGPEGIDYLCGVEVADRNHFFLHEGWLPSIGPNSVPPRSLTPRTFRLSVNENLDVNIEQ